MNQPRISFQTPEVASFYDSICQWSHPEFPFLDAHYCPGSYMPAVDMTFFIAKCLEANKYSAVAELMTFLASDSESTRLLLGSALLRRVPSWITLSEFAIKELQAIYLLLVRMSCSCSNYSASTAGRVAATTLACRQLAIGEGYYDTLLKYTKAEAKPLGLDAVNALQTAMSPLGVSELCANRIKSVTPMARLVVEDYITRSWGEGKIRPCLYYGERLYGCGSQDNVNNIELLGFFEPSNDAMEPSAEITKEILRESLEQNGLAVKKSAGRKQMIESARSISGLVAALISKVTPECKILRAEYEESVRAWATRVKTVEPVALAVLKTISL